MKKTIVYWLFAISFLNSVLLAGTTGKISGKLKDAETGEPLIGASVSIVGTSLGAVSDQDGFYTIINITPGVHEVRASFIGYNTVIQKNITVNADRTTHLDFALSPSAVSTSTIEVIGQREEIIKDLTSSQSIVDAEQIKTLPVENIADILQLQAGITKDAGGGLHMRGGRNSEIQYYIDGMAVSNPYSGVNMSVDVQNNYVQELQVISGTFNAEYGQAMSGIINIVTKDGGDKTEGVFTAYSGDFLSTNKDIFMNIDKINPLSQKYFEGSLSGSVPYSGNKLHYFVSGRFRDEENWLYGQRRYTPGDTVNFKGPDKSIWSVQQTGDNAIVSLNPSRNISYQGKLTYRPIENIKLSYSLLAENSEDKIYGSGGHANMYNPGALPTSTAKGFNNLFQITHTINANYYHELKLSYIYSNLERHAGDNPSDPVFIAGINDSHTMVSNVFQVGGIDQDFLYRSSIIKAIKYEVTGQVDRYNLVKLGAEYRQRQLTQEAFTLQRDGSTMWQVVIPGYNSKAHNYYYKTPVEFSAYLQDKIEIEDFIVNAGLRFDYFNAKSKVPTDMLDPHNDLHRDPSVAYRDVSAKTQLSPRLGFAFPISEKGNIHASYGQFFQIPEADRLYENSDFELNGPDFKDFLGNADLEAQRTTVFEIGLQQKVADNLILNTTCYYKDYRGLAGTRFDETWYRLQYGQYANVDYGSVWGIILSLDLLKTGPLSAVVDYTFQVADGNGSDPKEAFTHRQNRDEASKSLVPLDWDQRHVLNAIITYQGDSWGLTSLNKFSSGYPYNPATNYFPSSNIQLQNQGRYKPEYTMDLKFYKALDIINFQATLFASVENVFELKRIDRIPMLSERDLRVHEPLERFNSLYDYRLDPNSQPRPRLVKIGFTINI